MFAIVSIAGKQYKVHPGETILVDELTGKVGSTITFDKVFLLSDEKKSVVGKPVVTKAIVSAKILSHEKGEKITVRRFKSKVRYRKARGFRARLTKLEILKVSAA